MSVKIHPTAEIQSEQIGEGSQFWQHVIVLSGATIGSNCNICSSVFIENDVILGDRVTVKSGVQIWDGTRLEDEVFVGPNATFTNDRFPPSENWPQHLEGITVKRGAAIGANATLLPGIVVGEGAVVGAGAVVTRDVPAGKVVVGNPGKVVGSVEDFKNREKRR